MIISLRPRRGRRHGYKMNIIDTDIAGLKIVETKQIADHRGSFSRWFCLQELAAVLNHRTIKQINNSKSVKAGTVRGLHYQRPPHGEMKIVRCIRGRVWDVAVDLRTGSPTFLKWQGVELTDNNNRTFVVPEGFAHGYQALEPDSELLYINTEFYTPAFEGALHPEDPALSIQWPLPVTNLSKRDSESPFLSSDFKGFQHDH